MKATDDLKREHRGIELMLNVLTSVSARADREDSLNIEDLEASVEFLTVFADRCHHAKEEKFLFPALEEAGVRREGGPIGVMLAEHAKGRELTAQIKKAVEACKAGESSAPTDFSVVATEYVALLTAHIQKEDNLLFAIADSKLSPSKDQWLIDNFERLEIERIGEGRHDAFHQLLKRLKDTYLK